MNHNIEERKKYKKELGLKGSRFLDVKKWSLKTKWIFDPPQVDEIKKNIS